MQVTTEVTIHQANLNRMEDQQAVVMLVRAFAREVLSAKKQPNIQPVDLISGLNRHPTSVVFLAKRLKEYIGIITAFYGFSTFAARQTINIHDLHVMPDWRRQGVATRLLQAVEEKARRLNCCKLTLEVHDKNAAAQALYRKFRIKPCKPPQQFWEKPL